MVSEPFRFSNPDPFFSMASESSTILFHHHWFWCHRDNRHGCRRRSRLITLRLHPTDPKSPFAILYTYNLTFSNTIGFPLANIASLNFFPINPSSFTETLILGSPSTFCRDLPLESWRRTGLFVNEVVAVLLAKIGPFAHCGNSSDFNIVFVPCSRFPPSTSWVRHMLTRARATSSLSNDPSSYVPKLQFHHS